MHIGVQIWLLLFHFPYQFSEHSFAHISWKSVNTPCLQFCHCPQVCGFPGPGFRSASGCPGETEVWASSGYLVQVLTQATQSGLTLAFRGCSPLVHTRELSCCSAGSPFQHDWFFGSFLQILFLNLGYTSNSSSLWDLLGGKLLSTHLASKGLGPAI